MQEILSDETERSELFTERYDIAVERIKEIAQENGLDVFTDYFNRTAVFLLKMDQEKEWLDNGGLERASLTELQEHNAVLYEDILPQNYGGSYANPRFAVAALGSEYGQMLSFVAAELRSIIGYIYEGKMEPVVIRLELFLEIHHMFAYAFEETAGKEQGVILPTAEMLRETLYWFAGDYSEIILEDSMRDLFDWKESFARHIIMDSELTDLRYLYRYGECITENELRMAEYLNTLPDEAIHRMADTFTEGYRIGFQVTGKDITKKKSVNIRYFLGMERMVRQAVLNFGQMNLEPVIYRAPMSILNGRKLSKNGYYGAVANKQFEYDHEYDHAIFYDRKYVHRRLEHYRNALESVKELAAVHGGPAVIEDFGSIPFEPENKEENLKLNAEQQKLAVEFQSSAGRLMNEYVHADERSFTIIAFPVPEIGADFEQIFDGIMEINTLDYKLYQGMQQVLIDALDKADSVEVKGSGKNRTSLTVKLHDLAEPDKETNFENCVADVNIPLGEVFTSPVLTGTQGTLHVTKVYLNGLKYTDLEITFKDGMITDYNCSNFEEKEENRKLIRENILKHHDSLPMGEFAIGTNTTAYVFATRYAIGDKLPILIAEKMGPHFAVGDTCYSQEEDLITCNPDGKRLVAKDNEISVQRKEDFSSAYFNCHTDITIPYDELGELTAVAADGSRRRIIENGRFVLKGCEELNKAFEQRDK